MRRNYFFKFYLCLYNIGGGGGRAAAWGSINIDQMPLYKGSDSFMKNVYFF